MIRKYFDNIGQSKKEKITWRSHEVTRIEAFSDGVLAFGVSLLVVSLEVPKNSREMLESLWGFIPFAFCFASVFWIWRTQYRFFRRYGLKDNFTLGINAVLMFVTLAYVYPLKYICSTVMMGQAQGSTYVIEKDDYGAVFILFLAGYALINLLFAIMYVNAYLKKQEIKLNKIEVFETITAIWLFIIPFFTSVLVIGTAFVIHARTFNDINNCCLVVLIQILFMPVFKRRRHQQFKAKFGDTPEVEINHNPEG